jgi:hypothetical protein
VISFRTLINEGVWKLKSSRTQIFTAVENREDVSAGKTVYKLSIWNTGKSSATGRREVPTVFAASEECIASIHMVEECADKTIESDMKLGFAKPTAYVTVAGVGLHERDVELKTFDQIPQNGFQNKF